MTLTNYVSLFLWKLFTKFNFSQVVPIHFRQKDRNVEMLKNGAQRTGTVLRHGAKRGTKTESNRSPN